MPEPLEPRRPAAYIEGAGGAEAVLEVRGVERSFDGPGGRIDVLRGVDLSVRSGEIVGVVGASGVGKSTLLHVLGTLDRPDAGSVRIAGRDVAALDARDLDRLRNRTLGFVFQFHFLMPEFTALENVMMPLLIAGVDEAEARRRAGAWLHRVGLVDRASHRPTALSGGEQQRVAVARALVAEPEIVLADEPTGNLDPATGDAIHGLIAELARAEGRTFVVVTHRRDFGRFADRVFELIDGRLHPLEAGGGEGDA